MSALRLLRVLCKLFQAVAGGAGVLGDLPEQPDCEDEKDAGAVKGNCGIKERGQFSLLRIGHLYSNASIYQQFPACNE